MVTHSETDAPQRLDMRELKRVGIWGVVTATALGFAVIAATSDQGERRMAHVVATLNPLRVSPRPDDTEVRKLAGTLQALTAERDRLAARLDTLERNVGEITGSIARRPATQSPVQPASPPELAIAPADAMPAVVPQTSPPEPNPARTEFGIDLGPGANVEALRALWAAAKTRHGTLLDGLRPVISIRESTRAGGIELRLVVGPLGNAAAAARVCSIIVSTGSLCQPAVFEGQRLVQR